MFTIHDHKKDKQLLLKYEGISEGMSDKDIKLERSKITRIFKDIPMRWTASKLGWIFPIDKEDEVAELAEEFAKNQRRGGMMRSRPRSSDPRGTEDSGREKEEKKSKKKSNDSESEDSDSDSKKKSVPRSKRVEDEDDVVRSDDEDTVSLARKLRSVQKRMKSLEMMGGRRSPFPPRPFDLESRRRRYDS
jgi:uncharacterized protein with WD repeat